jgi:transcriptional regulator with XRE-family HTH domain
VNKDPGIAAKLRAKTQASELQIGSRLQMVREEKGLSQRELAKRAGVTPATISLIEQEAHAPSLASLHKILCAISLSLAEFFALPTTRRNVLVYGPTELVQISGGPAQLFVMGNERQDKSLQMFLEHYDVGAGTGEEPLSHDGETAVIVTKGKINLFIEDKTHTIIEGGGFHLFGKSPYRLENAGDERASIVCATTPPIAHN